MKRQISVLLAIVGLSCAAAVSGGLGLVEPPKKDSHGTKASKPEKHASKPAAKPAAHDDSHGDSHADDHGEDKAHDDHDQDSGSHDDHAPAKGDAPMPVLPAKPAAAAEEPTVDAEAALAFLMDGNTRWVGGQSTSPNTNRDRRASVAENGQKPFVTVLTCADSRLPVERMFDRGVGDVFVVRVAGNIASWSEIGTIEYGVGHLKTPLLVVMGHTKCGAVAAAASGAEVHGAVAELIGAINPAVDRARRNNPGVEGADLAALAVRENVWQTIYDIFKSSSEIRELAGKGELRIVGAIADISTGKVEWLGEHPWQTELMDAMASVDDSTAIVNGETAHADDDHGSSDGHDSTEHDTKHDSGHGSGH